MRPEEFCLWLGGFMDGVDQNSAMKPSQYAVIKRKLKEVDYEPAMDFEVDAAGEMFYSDNGQMFAIWNADTTCNLNVDQFNVDYIEK